MNGTVFKRGNRYYGVYYVGKDSNGKWKQKTTHGFSTKKDAQKELRNCISKLDHSLITKYCDETVSSFLHYWLKSYCEPNLAPNTLRGYTVNVDKHICKYIGDIKLFDLKPKHIQDLYTKLLADGLSGTSVRYVHNNLHKALSFACDEELIPTNPAEHVSPPKVNRMEYTTLNSSQMISLISQAKYTEIYLPVLLASTLGLRRNEALGLQWSDVDFNFHTITINHSAYYTKTTFELHSPKSSNSKRTLKLTDYVFLELKKAHDTYLQNVNCYGAIFNPYNLICTRADGSPITPNYLQQHFSKLLVSCGLPKIRFHDLRHTNATLMLRESVPAKIVSSMLGHSTIGITLDTYSHVITEMQDSAISVMNNLLAGL